MPLVAAELDGEGDTDIPGGINPFGLLKGFLGVGDGTDSETGVAGKGKRGRVAVVAKVRDARLHVSRLLTVVSAVAVRSIDPLHTMPAELSPALSDEERDLIEEPLAEIIAESKQLAKIAGVSSMLSLSVGCSMWGYRVFMGYRFKQMEQKVHEMNAGLHVVPAVEWPPDAEANKPSYHFTPESPEMYAPATNGVNDAGNGNQGG